MATAYGGKFRAKLFVYPGEGGWTFAPVPERLAPPLTHGWGRTPIHATVDGYAWKTSVWSGNKGDGDMVQVTIEFISL